MKSRKFLAATAILIVAFLAPILPSCTPAEAVESYTAVVPAVLQAGSRQAVSVALLKGNQPVLGRVEVTLLKDRNEISKATKTINGKGSVELGIPDVEDGDYRLRVKGQGFEDEAQVRIEKSFLAFLETDKPIYKPGQTIRMRAVTLDSELRPVSETVTVEVLDAKGIKIFRNVVATDEYGMVTLDLPISTEPNLGVWKITASTPKTKTQLDVRVEEYVLPKYEVKVTLPKEWFLASEPVKGKVAAEYSFGKPVKGDLEIKASRYVGQWQEYATFTASIDGEAEFTIPAVSYVAGVPAAGGLGNVSLDFAVVEKSTGYKERTNRLLTVAPSSLNIQIIPASSIFKPGLPFDFLVVTKTPDNKLVDARVQARITYLNKDFREVRSEQKQIDTSKGKALVTITPPRDSAALTIESSAQGAQASKTLEASYSPSGNFIHVEQASEGVPQLGGEITFKVYSTREAANFYYEVIARGKVVFTDFTRGSEISFRTTPLMAPSSKLLVYQILPNSEMAADYIPFEVEATYPQDVKVEFSKGEAGPGEEVSINIQTAGAAKVGIVAVDRSVFILAENRLNLQQVFDELERLYMKPQVELHDVSIYEGITNRGAKEIFKDAGVVVLSNNIIPEGKEYKNEMIRGDMVFMGAAEKAAPPAAPAPAQAADGGLAEVQRVRQFFPETWLWEEVITDAAGKASLKREVPDTITTWMLRAVALSKSAGLGVAENQLRAFQPFFLTVDLPYSAVRGEEFPVRVAVYNYLNEPQSVLVQIQEEDWFELLDKPAKTIEIEPNDIGGAEFRIGIKKLGVNGVKVTARSKQAADAVIKTLIVEAEGVARELVDNLVLTGGTSKEVDTSIPPLAVAGSGRAYLAVTASYLTQTIDGLEGLLQMPFGCGEQNMIVFAPDVFITRYLKASGQLKPEIMAKAEKLMLTGYQRELTYRRKDGSFSAFGESDKEGSLWLTAFVLKSFSQAKDLMYIDDGVLDNAKSWITSHQNADGSFDAVGFVHHQEMMGGLTGKTALTAYVAVALMEAGEKTGSARAVSYLETKLSGIEDSYTLALTTYALELAKSSKGGEAYAKLMKLAREDENGLYWGGDVSQPEPLRPGLAQPEIYPPRPKTADIEATAYATLALIRHGDALNASKASKWLVSKRNAYGGYGSTQDTVVALEALTAYAAGARADVNLEVNVESGGRTNLLRVTPDNFDVLQVVEVPIDEQVRLSVKGKGDAIAQVVRRFNLPEAGEVEEILKVSVNYDVTQVAVDDLVKVSVELAFNPPVAMEAGMTVLDVSVPTGFAPLRESIAGAIEKEGRIKRYDIAGRKVIFYIENLLAGDRLSFSFQVKAMYPVSAKGVSSRAYSYYKPEISGETLSRDMVVLER